MNLNELIGYLGKHEIGISINGDKLVIGAKPELLPADVLACLRENKQALIAWCQAGAPAHRANYTPSDFPNAAFGRRQLDELQARYPDLEKAYRCSPMQQGLLFHNLLDEGGQAYLIQARFDLREGLDARAFEYAWQQLVARHDVFRTCFAGFEDADIHQLVQRSARLPFTELDWSALEPDQQQARLDAFCSDDRRQGIDLACAPLMRIALIRLGGGRWHCVWTHHHALMDGWCSPIIYGELRELYDARVAGRSPALPEVMPYEDYIAWLGRQDRARSVSFWQQRLAPCEAGAMLPVAHHGSTTGQQHAALERTLDAAATAGLAGLARQAGTTMNLVVQLAWALLLQRYSRERTVVFGTTVSGRPPELAGVERMVGLFINTIPVVVELDERVTVGQVLARMQADNAAAFEHAWLPLYELQKMASAGGGSDLFDSLVIYENYPFSAAAAQDAAAPLHALDVDGFAVEEWTHYPVTVTAGMLGEQLALRLAYVADVGFSVDPARMLAHYCTLLQRIAAGGVDAALGDLDCVEEAERQVQLLWSDSATPYPLQTVHSLFEEQVRRTPDAAAAVCGSVSLSFVELDDKADRLAAWLGSRGARAGERVGILMDRSIEMLIAVLACMKAGCPYVALDPQLPRARVDLIIEDAAIAIVLAQGACAHLLPRHSGTLLVLDGAAADPGWLGDHAGAAGPAPVEPDALVYVLYTSGSTGTPKGVMVSHACVANYLSYVVRTYCGGVHGAVLSSPLAFDATVTTLFGSLLAGKPVMVIPAEDALEQLAQYLFHSSENWLFKITPAHLDALAGMPALVRAARAHVLVIGGEQLSARTVAQWKGTLLPNAVLVNEYGPTETTVGCSTFIIERYAEGEFGGRAAVPIGRPIQNARLYVTDGRRSLQPLGAVGELYIGGAGVASGYLNRSALTQEKFVANPFSPDPRDRVYRTGDLVRWLPDGNLEFIGRADHQVKIRGFRIELGDIEHQLGVAAGVREVAVLAMTDPAGKLGKYLVAYVVPTELPADEAGRAALVANYRHALQGALPGYMVPAAYVLLDALPLTANGKVDRKRLPPPGAGLASEAAYAAPRTLVEQQLCALWQDILGLAQVGVHDNFFELGGHSLLATRLAGQIRQRFGVELALRRLFEQPTVERLARLVEQGQGARLPAIEPVAGRGAIAPSFAQQRLWFIDRMHGGSAQYNVPLALELDGALDAAALRNAFGQIIARHEVLRTCFEEAGSEVFQRVLPWQAFELEVIDLEELDLPARQAELEQLALREAGHVFDLKGDLMLRAKLARLGARRHVLLLTLHHIASDGVSMGILIRELSELYGAEVAGRASTLTPLRIQYADFAHWQRSWLSGAVLDEQLGYWTRQLAGLPQVHGFPLDKRRPARQHYAGSSHQHMVPTDVQDGLRALCLQHGVTMFMLLQTAFAVLLHRYSKETDIVMGTPIAGRVHPEADELIGFFTNTLVLRNDFAGNTSFVAALAASRQMLIDAYTHQHVPFEMLVDALNPERDLRHNALCQIMFTLHNAPPAGFTLPGLEVRSAGQIRTVVKFDLELTACESGQGLVCQWDYNIDLFEADTITRVACNFEVLLRAIAADPGCAIGELSLASAAEQALLARWCGAPAPFPPRQCIHELFEEQAALAPDAVAVTFEHQQLSYGELNRRANQLARHLIARGARPDMPVALCLERSPAMVVAILGILKAGAAYVPVDPAYPAERITLMLSDCGATLALTESALAARLPLTGLETVCLDGAHGELIASYDAGNIPVAGLGLDQDKLAYVIYTSGSTGNPKAVAVEHRQIVFSTVARDRHYRLEKPSTPVVTSISFDVTTGVLFWSLCFGGTVHLTSFPASDLQRLMDFQGASGSNFLLLPVGLYRAVLQNPNVAVRVALVIVGGDALDAATCARHAERFPSVRLSNEYGPTEVTVWSTAFSCAELDGRASVPIGAPIPGACAYVLGAQRELLPVGALGELYLGGQGVARGYLGQDALTAEKFVADSFAPGARMYRTGDLARWLGDGNLAFAGRVDQQVKVRGYRIELGEIEHQLSLAEGVRDVLVLAREDERGDRQLVAYLTGERKLAIGVLRGHLEQRLPDYMVPAAYVQLERWPMTPNGKLDRQALPDPDEADRMQVQYAAPASEAEQVLCRIWQEVLGLERVGIDDNFFELGGSSHLSILLQHKIGAETGYDVSITDIFAYPTVAALAAHLALSAADDAATAAAPAPVADARSGAPDPSAAIAIIGMAGRFPDADSVDLYWANISGGIESVRDFSDETLLAAGVDPATLAGPNYVKSGILLDNLDLFDAAYFGFTPRDAEIMDPQQRLLFECASEALEQAGYGGGRNGREARDVGVFVSVGESAYLYQNLMTRPDVIGSTSYAALMSSNGKDFAATRLSYKLNLTGPSVNVGTACSSSLVGVHQACLSLRNGESSLALAGGAAIRALAPGGYVYEDGNVSSSDGHCRPFDKDAQGTVSGSAAGMVLLKRLADALADGDVIHAVILGSAINNDGADKVGYTAPSVGGQAKAIGKALEAAQVEPASVQYIETHGTATRLGDPIEIAGLQRAYGPNPSGQVSCAIGSVKANIGHCDTAAGIAGLIKTVQALRHQQLPPSINYAEPNAEIPFAGGRFYVNTALRHWPRGDTPRRAGVSSFGIGGTNAHLILEEAPGLPTAPAHGPALLVLSARSAAALDAVATRLADYLQLGSASLHDVAHTLQVGRAAHAHRRFVVCQSAPEAVAALHGPAGNEAKDGLSVVFVFPACCRGALHQAARLYAQPAFGAAIDACAQLLMALMQADLHAFLGVEPADGARVGYGMGDTDLPPSIADFVVQYALASLWQAWGVQPAKVVGRGVGELVAGCVAGLLSLESALALAIACEHGPEQYQKRLLATAFSAPRIVLCPSLHRTAANNALLPSEAQYWATLNVRMDEPASDLDAVPDADSVLRLVLGGSAPARDDAGRSLRELGCPADIGAVLGVAGDLWSAGIEIDWEALGAGRAGRRVALPTYPFERKRFWIAPASAAPQESAPALARQASLDDWFYMPSWQLAPPAPAAPAVNGHERADCLLFGDGSALCDRLAHHLRRHYRIVEVGAGDIFIHDGERYTINAREAVDYTRLIGGIRRSGRRIGMIVHAWNVEAGTGQPWELTDRALDHGFYSLLFLAKAIESETHGQPLELRVLASHLYRVHGDEAVHPDKGMLAGFCQALSQEMPSVHCQLVDVGQADGGDVLAAALARECGAPRSEDVLAYRGGRRWVQSFVRHPLPRAPAQHPDLKHQGVYLVTGGLGGIGMAVAGYLARTVQARLVLVARTPFPERTQWPQWLAAAAPGEPVSAKIRAILDMESGGAQVTVMAADVSSMDDMALVFAHIRAVCGRLDGIVHAAGVAGGGMLHLKTRDMARAVLDPKVRGAWVLHRLSRDMAPGFVVLCSSLASLVGAIGQSDYCAANAFLDAFASAQVTGPTRYVSVNWDAWAQAGLAAAADVPEYWADARSRALESGILGDEGCDAFARILAVPDSQVIVSTRDFVRLKEQAVASFAARRLEASQAGAVVAGPDEKATLEVALAEIWNELLGMENVGVDDDFFDLGGDSLLMTVLVNAVRKRMGIEVPVKMLFDYTTIGTLANAIRTLEPVPALPGILQTLGLIDAGAEVEEGEI